MNFADWLNNKFGDFSIQALAAYLQMDNLELIAILNGTQIPDYLFLIKVMYLLNLNTEEQLEFISLASETLDISPNALYVAIVNKLVEMTEENYSLKRQQQ